MFKKIKLDKKEFIILKGLIEVVRRFNKKSEEGGDILDVIYYGNENKIFVYNRKMIFEASLSKETKERLKKEIENEDTIVLSEIEVYDTGENIAISDNIDEKIDEKKAIGRFETILSITSKDKKFENEYFAIDTYLLSLLPEGTQVRIEGLSKTILKLNILYDKYNFSVNFYTVVKSIIDEEKPEKTEKTEIKKEEEIKKPDIQAENFLKSIRKKYKDIDEDRIKFSLAVYNLYLNNNIESANENVEPIIKKYITSEKYIHFAIEVLYNVMVLYNQIPENEFFNLAEKYFKDYIDKKDVLEIDDFKQGGKIVFKFPDTKSISSENYFVETQKDDIEYDIRKKIKDIDIKEKGEISERERVNGERYYKKRKLKVILNKSSIDKLKYSILKKIKK